jgi:hypothetical protein
MPRGVEIDVKTGRIKRVVDEAFVEEKVPVRSRGFEDFVRVEGERGGEGDKEKRKPLGDHGSSEGGIVLERMSVINTLARMEGNGTIERRQGLGRTPKNGAFPGLVGGNSASMKVGKTCTVLLDRPTYERASQRGDLRDDRSNPRSINLKR